jgi:Tfp pilus assembly PilM family ATPase
VIRQVSLPPVPPAKILPALEIQHRDLGLLPPGDAVTDAQILRKSGDGSANEILSVSVPKSRIEERLRLLRQAAVDVQVLDVEPLALLNAAIRLTELDSGELLVLLTVGHQTSVLCLWSERGPVVARYLNIGASAFAEPLRLGLGRSDASTRELARALSPQDIAKAEAACRELVERIADDVRLSLTFYRTEYDRESLPRYGIGGSLDLPYLGRWVADRLGLGAPPELLDPFKAVDVLAPPTGDELLESGPEFLQAFGLALRGV